MTVRNALDLYREVGPSALTDETLDVAAHHQSLHATIDWTVGLLDSKQKELLEPLAVFSGSFDWTALLAVAIPQEERTPADLLDVADRLAGLVAAGLVRQLPESGRSPSSRYVVPDAVRTYALHPMEENGSLPILRWRHSDHYRRQAHGSAGARWAWGGTAVARRFIDDRDEYLGALDLLVADGDVVNALSLAVDLEGLWMMIGAGHGVHRVQELLEWARRSPRWSGEDQAVLTTRALTSSVLLAVWSRQPWRNIAAHGWLAEAQTTARRIEDSELLLQAMCAEVQLLVMEGNPELGLAAAERALREPLARVNGFWRMTFLRWRAVAGNNSGDPRSAIDDAVAARDLARAAGDEHELLLTSHVLTSTSGASSALPGEVPEPEDLLERARALGDERTEGLVVVGAAVRYAATGDHARSARFVLDTLELARRSDASYLEEMGLLALVGASVSARRLEAGIRLHGALQACLPALRASLHSPPLALYDARVAVARTSLGEVAFDRLVASGRLLTWSAAVATARALASELAANTWESATSGLQGAEHAALLTVSGARLSRREVDVLRLLASGCSTKTIAVSLALKPKSVTHYLSSLYRKLKVTNRTEAVVAAWKSGLLAEADLQSGSTNNPVVPGASP
jgi:DNA-binding CsgD family transcriptional regulator